MNILFHVTGSIICSECGNFMVPELHRLPNEGPNGLVTVRGHKLDCSLFGKSAVVRLPQVKAIEISREASQSA